MSTASAERLWKSCKRQNSRLELNRLRRSGQFLGGPRGKQLTPAVWRHQHRPLADQTTEEGGGQGGSTGGANKQHFRSFRKQNACLPLLADRGITTTLRLKFCSLLLKRQSLLSFQWAGNENGNIGCTLRRGGGGGVVGHGVVVEGFCQGVGVFKPYLLVKWACSR